MDFDGIVAAETFADVTEIPEGYKIVDAKWLYKRKGDSLGMVDRSKARMVAVGYSQVEGLDYFERFAPTASATSNRFGSGHGMQAGLGPEAFRCRPGSIQSELDTDIYLRLPPVMNQHLAK